MVDVNGSWGKLKNVLLTAADDVCGWTKGKPRQRQKWEWNEDIHKAWQEKWRWEMVYNMTGTETAKKAYQEALKRARLMGKREFYRKMEEETKGLESDVTKCKVFKLAKRLKSENQDITGTNGLKMGNMTVWDTNEKLKIERLLRGVVK